MMNCAIVTVTHCPPDELLERIKGELSKLGPILEVREPHASKTERVVDPGELTIETAGF